MVFVLYVVLRTCISSLEERFLLSYVFISSGSILANSIFGICSCSSSCSLLVTVLRIYLFGSMFMFPFTQFHRLCNVRSECVFRVPVVCWERQSIHLQIYLGWKWNGPVC